MSIFVGRPEQRARWLVHTGASALALYIASFLYCSALEGSGVREFTAAPRVFLGGPVGGVYDEIGNVLERLGAVHRPRRPRGEG